MIGRRAAGTAAIACGLVTLGAVIAVAPGTPATAVALAATPSSGAACSLTKPKKRQAVQAWEAMMPVFRHPRCTNCHGGVNPTVPFAEGGHRGGAVTDTTQCGDCHGLLPGWRVPRPVLHFTTKDNRELCIFIKRIMSEGPHIFVEHIQFEPFVPPFIVQAFKGDKALNTLGEVTLRDDFGIQHMREPPPGSHADLIQKATNWGTIVGRAWADSPECGCELDGAWVGTVTARGTFRGFGGPGTVDVTSRADVVLEEVQVDGTGIGVKTFHSIAGTVRWDLLVSGGCRGNAGGTLTLDGKDDMGHPMAQLRLEESAQGVLQYQPTTGSAAEAWSPVFNVQCTMSGTTISLPLTNPMPTWWHYDVPNLITSTDKNRLKGSYRWEPAPGSVVIWEWNLERK